MNYQYILHKKGKFTLVLLQRKLEVVISLKDEGFIKISKLDLQRI